MILACRHCRILFEAETSVNQFCTRCDRLLVPHLGETPPDDDDIFSESHDAHTELLSGSMTSADIDTSGPQRVGDIELRDAQDDIAHFGVSTDGSIDHTRLLSVQPAIRGPGADETRMLSPMDDPFSSLEMTAVLGEAMPETAHTEKTQQISASVRPKRADKPDASTSIRDVGSADAGRPRRARPVESESSRMPPPFKAGRRPRSRQPPERSSSPSIDGSKHVVDDQARSGGKVAGPPPYRRTVSPPISKAAGGPDPTPKYGRIPRAKRPKARPAEVVAQASLDHARPRALSLNQPPPMISKGVGGRRSKAPTTQEGGRSSLSMHTSRTGHVDDALGDLIAEHRMNLPTASDDSPHLIKVTPSRFSTTFWSFAALTLIGSIVVLVGRESPNEQTSVTASVMPKTDVLAQALSSLSLRALPVNHADLALDIPFIALGTEGVRSSIGTRLGLTSMNIPEARIARDEKGSWIELLRRTLSTSVVKKSRIALALDRGATARHVWLLAQSVHRAGFQRIYLVVERASDGELGLLSVAVDRRKIPSAGQVAIRLDEEGLFTSVIARDGSRLTADMPPVRRRSGGDLNFDAIDDRFHTLTRRFPLIRAVSLHVDPRLSLPDLVRLIHSLRHGPEKERFTTVRLSVK
ncbi:MAG: hypothetical protein VX589_15495 [Myxococcota bacterium]|nr:hypothetical protein [Myxococcota bacterium]